MHFENSIRIETDLGRPFQNRSFINGETSPLNPDEWKGESTYYLLNKVIINYINYHSYFKIYQSQFKFYHSFSEILPFSFQNLINWFWEVSEHE